MDAPEEQEATQGEELVGHEWRFRIGDAFPADSPLARFIVAVGAQINDNLLSNTHFIQAEKGYESTYFFLLASSHLYEAAETLRQSHREWQEVQDFVATLDDERRDEFTRVAALADPAAAFPGPQLKEIRNAFFHYLRLDATAAAADRLPLAAGLAAAAGDEGVLIIEADARLGGIRALFADEILIKTLTASYADGELERVVGVLANFQADLNRFAQAALGRYLRELPEGVVSEKPLDARAKRAVR